jgi:hypothetical protein
VQHNKEHTKEGSLNIYIDSSSIKGKIGSIALCLLTQQVRSIYIGLDIELIVYIAEL